MLQQRKVGHAEVDVHVGSRVAQIVGQQECHRTEELGETAIADSVVHLLHEFLVQGDADIAEVFCQHSYGQHMQVSLDVE